MEIELNIWQMTSEKYFHIILKMEIELYMIYDMSTCSIVKLRRPQPPSPPALAGLPAQRELCPPKQWSPNICQNICPPGQIWQFLTHHSSPLTGRAQVPAQVFGFHNRDSAPTTQRSTRPWQPRESLWQNLSLDSLLIKSFSFSFRDSLLFKSPNNDIQTSVSFSFR